MSAQNIAPMFISKNINVCIYRFCGRRMDDAARTWTCFILMTKLNGGCFFHPFFSEGVFHAIGN